MDIDAMRMILVMKASKGSIHGEFYRRDLGRKWYILKDLGEKEKNEDLKGLILLWVHITSVTHCKVMGRDGASEIKLTG